MILPGLPFGLAGGKKPIEFVGGRAGFLLGSKTVGLTGLSGGVAPSPDTGDLVIIALAVSQSGESFAASTPGYTQLFNSASSVPSFAMFYKRLSSAESSFQFTSNFDTTAGVYVWRNTNEMQPIDATAALARGSSGSPNSPSVTTITANAVVVACGARTTGSIGGAPSGMENFISSGVMALSSILRPSAGTYDPGAFTSSSGNWAAATIALRPK